MRQSKKQPMPCLHCGEIVMVPPHRFDTFKYCSKKCSALAARVQIERICEVCSTPFTHISSRSNSAKYCSRTCYHKAQHLRGSVKKNCLHCDKEFLTSPSKNRKFCSIECRVNEQKTKFNPTFQTVRKSMKRRDMITSCERCGYDDVPQILGVHHKDRNRRNNAPDNLEVLCPNCHSLEHLKHIPHGFIE